MHPQCAVRRADLKRMEKIKTPPKKVAELSPWQRVCPRCREIAHVRKKHCTCGHNFAFSPRAAGT
jgi:hypothetical protein